MSKKKSNKIEFTHGGKRDGAGHPETGVTKEKICVSVDKKNWNTAKKRWKDKPSRLVDWLVSSYVGAVGNTLEGRGAI
jgi:hypothetical protein